MKILFYDSTDFFKKSLEKFNKDGYELHFTNESLSLKSVHLAKGFEIISAFVNSVGTRPVLQKLKEIGVNAWMQRSVGYNRIDIEAATELGIKIYRVPNYSSETVAEFALALLMAVNRKVHIANIRTKNFNFSIDGLLGKAIFKSTVGVIGAGRIGKGFIKAVKGLGANVIVLDEFCKEKDYDLCNRMDFKWATLNEIAKKSDFVSIHAPLTEQTRYMFDKNYFDKAKKGQFIINTARGRFIKTRALINAIENGKIAGAGLDVLERETGRFFCDLSDDTKIRKDKEWTDLLKLDNVIVTSHQGFLTNLAVDTIANVTMENIKNYLNNKETDSRIYWKTNRIING